MCCLLGLQKIKRVRTQRLCRTFDSPPCIFSLTVWYILRINEEACLPMLMQIHHRFTMNKTTTIFTKLLQCPIFVDILANAVTSFFSARRVKVKHDLPKNVPIPEQSERKGERIGYIWRDLDDECPCMSKIQKSRVPRPWAGSGRSWSGSISIWEEGEEDWVECRMKCMCEELEQKPVRSYAWEMRVAELDEIGPFILILLSQRTLVKLWASWQARLSSLCSLCSKWK